MSDQAQAMELKAATEKIRTELAKVIIGQETVIDDLLGCFLSGGHCIITGVPGLAKTTLVGALAKCLDLEFNRVQFTPDLMPSDITGSEILAQDRAAGTSEFKFIKGPLFSNIVLADEINRTPPKTQSALLQAMQEQEVTSSGYTYKLPEPFWVLATQNPIEQEGTYPLPEAQLDRFMFSIEIGYPELDAELQIARRFSSMARIEPVLTLDEIISFRDLAWRVPVADSVVNYAVRLTRSTRPQSSDCPQDIKKYLTWGAGPRASQFLVLAAKTYALLDGRPTPDIEDIRRAAFPVLRHRLVRSFHGDVEGVSSNDLVKRLIEEAP